MNSGLPNRVVTAIMSLTVSIVTQRASPPPQPAHHNQELKRPDCGERRKETLQSF